MFTHVDGLFLDDLLLLLLCEAWSVTTASRIAIASVATLLGDEGLSAPLRTTLRFPNNKVRGAIEVGVACLTLLSIVYGVLTYVVEYLAALKVLDGPPSHIIVGLFLLQAL